MFIYHLRLQRGSQQETLTFPSNQVPMLCPPQPWSTPYNGGYLIAHSNLIRLPHQAYQQWDRVNATPPVNMYPSLDSLNQLGSIPWRVNTHLLDVALTVFNSGGNSKLDVPEPPSALPTFDESINDAQLTKKEKFQIFRQKLLHRRRQGEMYSLWCDALYRLSLANHVRNLFWKFAKVPFNFAYLSLCSIATKYFGCRTTWISEDAYIQFRHT